MPANNAPFPPSTMHWLDPISDERWNCWSSTKRSGSLAVPDAISCAPNPDEGAPPCTPQGAATTSNGDRYYDNVMGRTPGGTQMPNGVDFWWDEFPTNSGDCWYRNIGSDGTTGGITSDPPPPPVEGTSIPKFLPEEERTALTVKPRRGRPPLSRSNDTEGAAS